MTRKKAAAVVVNTLKTMTIERVEVIGVSKTMTKRPHIAVIDQDRKTSMSTMKRNHRKVIIGKRMSMKRRPGKEIKAKKKAIIGQSIETIIKKSSLGGIIETIKVSVESTGMMRITPIEGRMEKETKLQMNQYNTRYSSL